MDVDSNFRAELVSSLLGQDVKPYRAFGHLLSLEEFHLITVVGNRIPDKELFLDEEAFFDPQYDFDFLNLSDSTACSRGNEAYRRPAGWYRMALKVKGKYPDGDTWLGPNGWRTNSVAGEWPVSYHGTTYDGAKGIIREHYKAGAGAVYGRGIYSTPDLSAAEQYARIFKSKGTGKTYQVILQNRINPSQREICSKKNYWLIPVEKGTSAETEKCIVERSIRPYGILIRELNMDGSTHQPTAVFGETCCTII